jgi:DNA-binding NarL/FixJ family response regulator
MPAIGSVLVADDHPLFRTGLAALLADNGVEVVGQAVDGLDALQQARDKRPDVILMDVRMPQCDGVRAARLILQELPSTKIVMLTVSDSDEDLFAAIRAGVSGYLLKNVAPDELLRLLQGIADGEAPISGAVASRLLRQFATAREKPPASQPAQPTHQLLTGRELQVLRCIAAGNSNREVGEILAISENTVKNHLRRTLEKLRLQNRVQAVTWAIRQGLVQEGA